jgi:alpha-L-fucosidase
MKVNGEAIYGTKANPIETVSWGRITKKESANGTILYFSVFDWPADGKFFIPNLKNKVVSARLLSGGEIKVKSEKDGIEIKGPDEAPNQYASVIKIEFKGNIEPVKIAAKENMKTGELDK